jgi:thiamine pyrophosphate-dependent acetolactate synthase large subunit-like protein
MTELNGGQLAVRQLAAAGVDTIFGVVAGPMIEIMAAGVESGLRVVNCRHEVSAGFMASAWGYQKRLPGVVVVGSGPGMTNAVTPMHVASESAMPLVVLGGSTYGPTRGLGGFQEADQMAFAQPGCKWTRQVDSTARIPEYVHLALGRSVSGRPGAVYLDFPGHVVGRRVEEERVRFRESAPQVTRPHPDPNAIDALADMLARAERPLLVIGKGAAWSGAGEALQRLVDRGIPYVCSPMSRGTIPDDHPGFMNATAGACAVPTAPGSPSCARSARRTKAPWRRRWPPTPCPSTRTGCSPSCATSCRETPRWRSTARRSWASPARSFPPTASGLC